MSDALLDSPKGFSFYQAVYLAERLSDSAGIVGKLGPVGHEPVRFRAQLGLGFPSSEIGAASLVHPVNGEQGPPVLDIETNFLGLYGSSSPLPADITERLLWSDDTGTMRDFLDIFNHRLLSLLYRIWHSSRAEFERTPALDDPFSTIALCLAGLGDDDVKDDVDKGSLLSSLRSLVGWSRSAHDLKCILIAEFPDVSWQVDEFVPREFVIPTESQWKLGRGILGEDIVLGDRMKDITGRIRLRLETAHWDSYICFLPEGANFPKLTHIARRFLRDPLEILVVPSMPASTARSAQLTGADFRLGLNTWLGIPDDACGCWPSFTLGYE